MESFIIENHKTGSVSSEEHTTYLMMWLEHFVFCCVSCGPTFIFQFIVVKLANDVRMPLGKYLLDATYDLLHLASIKSFKFEAIGNLGGPWWFMLAWLNIYTSRLLVLQDTLLLLLLTFHLPQKTILAFAASLLGR